MRTRIEAIVEVAESPGIRIRTCRGSGSVGELPGGRPPDSCVQREGQITGVDLPMFIEKFNCLVRRCFAA
jgi:hypothetical protein